MALYDTNGVRVKMQDISQIRVKLTGKTLAGIKFTTPPTTTEYFVGDTMDWTGAVVSTINEMGTAIEDVTSQCTFSPVSGYEFTTSDVSNYKQLTATCTIDGVTYTATMACKVITTDLESMTWEQISNYIKAGKANRMVGGTKSFVYDGNTYNAKLISANDGTGDYADWYPANTADFLCNEVTPTTVRYSTTSPSSWKQSNLRTVSAGIYDELPSDLKAVIIGRTHKFKQQANSATMEEVTDNVWVPSAYEFGVIASNAGAGESLDWNKRWFGAGQSPALVDASNTSVNRPYWTSSIFDNAATKVTYLRAGGGNKSYSGTVPNQNYVPIAFRLGQA